MTRRRSTGRLAIGATVRKIPGLGISWNLEAEAGTVKVGMWVLEMLFS